MSDRPKAIKVHIELDNGSVLSADGEHAAEAWEWLEDCEGFCCVTRGWKYSGKPLIISQPATPSTSQEKDSR